MLLCKYARVGIAETTRLTVLMKESMKLMPYRWFTQ